MTEDTFGADLDAALAEPRSKGPCQYVRDVPKPLREIIDQRIAAGVNKWTAIANVVQSHGCDVHRAVIREHYVQGHEVDR